MTAGVFVPTLHVHFIFSLRNSLQQMESFPPSVPFISCTSTFGFSSVISDFTCADSLVVDSPCQH